MITKLYPTIGIQFLGTTDFPFLFFGVAVNDVPYWMVGNPEIDLCNQRVAWFDAGSELFRDLPLPGFGVHEKTHYRSSNCKDFRWLCSCILHWICRFFLVGFTGVIPVHLANPMSMLMCG